MLENARRQFLLVAMAVLAAIVCTVTLTPPFGPDLRGGIQLRYELPPDVLARLTAKENVTVAEIMEQTISVIQDRIDPTGTLDASVVPSGDTGILVELPSMEPAERDRVLERIANLGRLEMRMVADRHYVRGEVKFDMAAEKQRLEQWLRTPGNRELLLEELPRTATEIRRFNEDLTAGPIQLGHLAWYPRLISPQLENGDLWDHTYSTTPELQDSVVKVYDDAAWNGGGVPDAYKQKEPRQRVLLELIALNMHDMFFTGEDLDPAGVSPGTGQDGGLVVHYAIADRKSDYSKWSEDNTGKCSAIVLNGIVKSAPKFLGRIPGVGQIQGDFTREEVDELVKVLRTGSLRIEPELQSRNEIGPTLGAESIQRGLLSLIAGALAVFVAVLWYYRIAGIVACVALTLNVFLLWAGMLFMQATITLPGLGGIVLTLGMAVDANVLVYERIREELERGKDLIRAVRAGFDRAMSAILDSNITTFLTGLVLYNVGVGPVRGFAVTLMVGIVTTVFTQFFVTRLMFHWLIVSKRLKEYRPRRLIRTPTVDWVRFVRPACVGSALVLGAGLAYALFVVPREQMLSMDFTGGADLRMVVSQPMTADQVRDRLASDPAFKTEYPSSRVNTVEDVSEGGRATQFNVRMKLDGEALDKITSERAAYRAARREAEEKELPPPPPYKQPYVRELERVFAQELVKPAFTDALLVPHDANQNLRFAQVALHFQQPVEIAEAERLLREAKLGEVRVTALGAEPAVAQGQDLLVEWTAPATLQTWELFETVRAPLDPLKAADGSEVVLSDPFPAAQEIQGRLVGELRNAAIGALILSWVLIILYLRIRFHEYKYGLAAVLALVHDVLFTFIVVVLFNHLGIVHAEISLSMIAAFLTIIGYSVNDTIVIFDRIRELVHENVRLGAKEAFRDLINRALNMTMSRTILTSSLTALVVVAQLVVNLGSESDLESFAFAMLVGMFTGVYSTVFIAAPLLILMRHEPSVPAPPPAVEAPVV